MSDAKVSLEMSWLEADYLHWTLCCTQYLAAHDPQMREIHGALIKRLYPLIEVSDEERAARLADESR